MEFAWLHASRSPYFALVCLWVYVYLSTLLYVCRGCFSFLYLPPSLSSYFFVIATSFSIYFSLTIKMYCYTILFIPISLALEFPTDARHSAVFPAGVLCVCWVAVGPSKVLSGI